MILPILRPNSALSPRLMLHFRNYVTHGSGSSSRWLQRSRSDVYNKGRHPHLQIDPSVTHNFVSRAAFKLVDLDIKHKLIRKGDNILDLGAAPGGWTQVALHKLRGSGRVVAVDLLDLNPRVRSSDLAFVKGDFTLDETQKEVSYLIGGDKMDLVLSDMLANMTGNHTVDSVRSVELCDAALRFAAQILSRRGPKFPQLVLKVLQSQEADHFRKSKLEVLFNKVKVDKPASSRDESRELWWVCYGFRGRGNAEKLYEADQNPVITP